MRFSARISSASLAKSIVRYGAFPVAEHAEALEVGHLLLDLLARVGAALGLHLDARQVAAVGLLDLVLDRQAVAVPARHVEGVEAGELRRLHHHVLQDLVDGMARGAAGRWRTAARRAARTAARRGARRAAADRRLAPPTAGSTPARAWRGRRASGRACRGDSASLGSRWSWRCAAVERRAVVVGGRRFGAGRSVARALNSIARGLATLRREPVARVGDVAADLFGQRLQAVVAGLVAQLV